MALDCFGLARVRPHQPGKIPLRGVNFYLLGAVFIVPLRDLDLTVKVLFFWQKGPERAAPKRETAILSPPPAATIQLRVGIGGALDERTASRNQARRLIEGVAAVDKIVAAESLQVPHSSASRNRFAPSP